MVKQAYKLPLEGLRMKTGGWFSFEGNVAENDQVIASLPISRSTGVSFKGHLLSVGGVTKQHQASGDIFLYQEERDEWLLVGRVPTPRYNCLVEVVGDQLVVVGGWLDNYSKCDIVEIATLSLSV